MLGNFSFGDYFKREAIHWAWEFLTSQKWLGLDPERLSATVYLDDDEAAGIWLDEIKLPPERLQRLGEDENFWPANAPSQGPDGVCGPCSEIYYHTPLRRGGDLEPGLHAVQPRGRPARQPPPAAEQEHRHGHGPGADGRGAAGRGDRTSTSTSSARWSRRPARSAACATSRPSENGRRLRRIADHVRACTFAIHENVYPGNKKQGYVIRRLLRRAVLDGHQMGVREPFLHKLVAKVAELMKQPYPELGETVDRVANVIEKEEANFLAHHRRRPGPHRADLRADEAASSAGMVSGAEAADMFQTHGFPPELFETMAAERNLAFDWKGFRAEMEQHGIESGGGQKVELFRHGPLEALKKAVHGSRFLGYETLEVGRRPGDRHHRQRPALRPRSTRSTTSSRSSSCSTRRRSTARWAARWATRARSSAAGVPLRGHRHARSTAASSLHRGHLREGRLELGAAVTARVDAERRQGIRRAHSATHLLHFALQKHLGKHALQQGSKVDDDLAAVRLRQPRGRQRRGAGPHRGRGQRRDSGRRAGRLRRNMPLAEARKAGAMMLFGEKYPDVVRVVSMGEFSKELCGGTHLDNTGQVGLFKIIGEESVAAGTRRITALTGRAALEQRPPARRPPRPDGRRAARFRRTKCPSGSRPWPRRSAQLKKQAAAGPKGGGRASSSCMADAAEVGGVKVVVAEVPGGPQRAAAVDRPASPQGRARWPCSWPIGRKRSKGDADRRPEPRPGRARAGRGGLGPRGGRRRSAAAAAAGPTWPRPAASCPTSSPQALEAARSEIEKFAPGAG